jgi:hypothetical protein
MGPVGDFNYGGIDVNVQHRALRARMAQPWERILPSRVPALSYVSRISGAQPVLCEYELKTCLN